MNSDEKVSVITASYNSVNFLRDTIESVLNQSYNNLEHIIIDDFSIDNSREVILEYAKKDERIVPIFLESNKGAAVARNTGIERASGRYIAFLDSDDLWTKDKLKKQIEWLNDNNYEFIFSRYSIINEHGRDIDKKLRFPDKVNYIDLLKTCYIGCLTVMIDREKLNGFDISMPLLRKGQDYALWLKLLKKIDFAYCYPENLAKYRIRKSSLSRNKFHKMRFQWNIYRRIEGLDFFNSLYNILHYAYNGFKKNKI